MERSRMRHSHRRSERKTIDVSPGHVTVMNAANVTPILLVNVSIMSPTCLLYCNHSVEFVAYFGLGEPAASHYRVTFQIKARRFVSHFPTFSFVCSCFVFFVFTIRSLGDRSNHRPRFKNPAERRGTFSVSFEIPRSTMTLSHLASCPAASSSSYSSSNQFFGLVSKII